RVAAARQGADVDDAAGLRPSERMRFVVADHDRAVAADGGGEPEAGRVEILKPPALRPPERAARTGREVALPDHAIALVADLEGPREPPRTFGGAEIHHAARLRPAKRVLAAAAGNLGEPDHHRAVAGHAIGEGGERRIVRRLEGAEVDEARAG